MECSYPVPQGKKLMEIAMNIGLERRWNNTQHQPEEAVIRILKFCRLQGRKHSETLVEESRFEVELLIVRLEEGNQH